MCQAAGRKLDIASVYGGRLVSIEVSGNPDDLQFTADGLLWSETSADGKTRVIRVAKLDGTARGGIVVAVQRELGVPVKLVGLGEGPDDLAPFDPQVFASALIEG